MNLIWMEIQLTVMTKILFYVCGIYGLVRLQVGLARRLEHLAVLDEAGDDLLEVMYADLFGVRCSSAPRQHLLSLIPSCSLSKSIRSTRSDIHRTPSAT